MNEFSHAQYPYRSCAMMSGGHFKGYRPNHLQSTASRYYHTRSPPSVKIATQHALQLLFASLSSVIAMYPNLLHRVDPRITGMAVTSAADDKPTNMMNADLCPANTSPVTTLNHPTARQLHPCTRCAQPMYRLATPSTCAFRVVCPRHSCERSRTVKMRPADWCICM